MPLIEDFSQPLGQSLSLNSFYQMAMSHTKKDYDWAEFGVYKGITGKIWLKYLPTDKKIYFFDSFKGLPEEWANSTRSLVSPIGTFAIDPPNFGDPRAVLQIGWFEDTVPTFVENYKEKFLSFIHIDCDLYSSTKTVLNGLKDLISPKTVIVFDELCGELRHQEHEYKAFEEFVLENKLIPKYICNEKMNSRVALRLKNALD